MSSILIRDVDKELYAKIKSYASTHGLKIGQVLDEAMREWLKNQGNKDLSDDTIQNEIAFQHAKSSLEKDHTGKWGLICQGRLMCIKNSFREIVQYKIDHDIAEKTALVFKIGRKPREVILNVNKRVNY